MKFQLKEARRNKVNVTYYVLDEDSICGSINVKPEDSAALLKHWSPGPAEPSNTNHGSHLPPHQSPVSALAKAFLKGRTKFTPQQVLRGCHG
jgi:hypothetical protein